MWISLVRILWPILFCHSGDVQNNVLLLLVWVAEYILSCMKFCSCCQWNFWSLGNQGLYRAFCHLLEVWCTFYTLAEKCYSCERCSKESKVSVTPCEHKDVGTKDEVKMSDQTYIREGSVSLCQTLTQSRMTKN